MAASRARSRIFVTCERSCSAASNWLNSCRTSCAIRRGAGSRARRLGERVLETDIEDFINQPELFRQLLQPIIELEGALRAKAELDNINNKLYASFDEEVPEEYRGLVQEYYRVLSEGQGSDSPRQ